MEFIMRNIVYQKSYKLIDVFFDIFCEVVIAAILIKYLKLKRKYLNLISLCSKISNYPSSVLPITHFITYATCKVKILLYKVVRFIVCLLNFRNPLNH